jgi:hypothetical protein
VCIWRVKLRAFVVATRGAALTRALLDIQTPFIEPDAAFSTE